MRVSAYERVRVNPAAGRAFEAVVGEYSNSRVRQRRAADAVPTSREAVALVPENANARVMLAAADCLELVTIPRARGGSRLRRRSPTAAGDLGVAGAGLLRLGQLDEAEQAAIKAEQLGPQMPHAIMALAAVRLASGVARIALAIARRAIAIRSRCTADSRGVCDDPRRVVGVDETLAYARAARARDPRRGWAYMSEMC